MRKIFFPIIALLACMFTSCSEDIDYTLDNDCIITSFSLGQVKRTMHTLDEDGNDSTYIINYAGTICPMTIDQINNKINNKDSLPYGSDPSSILATISSVGSVAYCKAGEPIPEWKIYSSSDSIDFSQPLTFRVMSSDGKAYREYEKVKASIAEELDLLEDKLDDDFRELVKEELAENKERLEELQKEIFQYIHGRGSGQGNNLNEHNRKHIGHRIIASTLQLQQRPEVLLKIHILGAQ